MYDRNYKIFKYYLFNIIIIICSLCCTNNIIFDRYFVDQKPIWEEQTELILPNNANTVDHSLAQYTGGYVSV